MKVAILLTGRRPAHRVARFGTAADAFHKFLTSDAASTFGTITMDSYDCWNGDVPAVDTANRYDLLIVPGSSRCVNSGEKWIGDVERLVACPDRKPWVLGVCFGHELICKAYGGSVGMMGTGAEVGVSAVYVACDRLGIECESATRLNVLQSHKMEVSSVPEGFTVWASNEHCPVQGVFSREKRTITTQFHPDFSKDYLLSTASGEELDDAKIEKLMRTRLDHAKVLDIICKVIANEQL